MLVAHDSAGTRIEASRRTPPAEYFCPTCGQPVVAKPGRVKIPHFAHVVRSDCPSAGESLDHLRGKKVLAEQFRVVGYEVALEEPHPRERRVDVAVTLPHPLRPLRYAVEVQNSAIDPREMFPGRSRSRVLVHGLGVHRQPRCRVTGGGRGHGSASAS